MKATDIVERLRQGMGPGHEQNIRMNEAANEIERLRYLWDGEHWETCRLRTRVAELEKALRFMLNVFGQDGLGDGAEGDAVEHARKVLRIPLTVTGQQK